MLAHGPGCNTTGSARETDVEALVKPSYPVPKPQLPSNERRQLIGRCAFSPLE